jgi:hypothetical protein
MKKKWQEVGHLPIKNTEFGYDLTPDIIDGACSEQHLDRMKGFCPKPSKNG